MKYLNLDAIQVFAVIITCNVVAASIEATRKFC